MQYVGTLALAVAVQLAKFALYIVCAVLAVVAAAFYIERLRSDHAVPEQKITLELYPWDGFHNRANFEVTGDMANETQPYHDYDWRFGPLGYLNTFDIRKPPPKAEDEIRVILIGGSATFAGPRTNEDMLDRKLELRLNQLMSHSSMHVRVINMGVGGSVTYQNFFSLNQWGHQLQPDIILSYSGRNDLWVPFNEGGDGYFGFREVNHLVTMSDRTSQADEPLIMRWLAEQFPHLYWETPLPLYLKLLFWEKRYQDIADARYRKRRGIPQALQCCGRRRDAEAMKVNTGIALRSEIHGLQSIKRDFLGIPMIVAWQALNPSEFPDLIGMRADDYEQFYEAVVEQTRGYLNDDWLFINVNAEFARKARPSIGTHLGNEGSVAVANFIADNMIGMVRKVSEARVSVK
jgi:hypothetical protein